MSATRYEFGAAAEDRSLVLGLRGPQLAVLGVALVAAVGIVRSAGGVPGAFLVAIGIVSLAAASTLWPLAGRTAEQWAPVALRWGLQRLTGRSRHISRLPLLGHDSDGGLIQDPPPSLADTRLLGVPLPEAGGREVGVIHDASHGTYTAVLSIRGSAFQLADTPEKERRLGSWGALLSGLARAGSPIHRMQWLERTAPEDGDAMGRYLVRASQVPRNHPSLASYLELVDQAGPVAPAHETFLALSISTTKARRAIRQAGGGHDGAVQVLLRELTGIQRQLAGADLKVEGILTPRLLAGTLRTAFEPFARAPLARRNAAADDQGGTSPANAWPLATETTWSTYRTADVWHVTYWIAQWPRSPVGADFLAPLLLGSTAIRAVAVTMQPISPARAHREVEQAVLKSHADEEVRARAGFTTTARRRRGQETAARRERELADGHADYRLAGYLTVSASSREELHAACGEVEQLAQQSALELRRLDGQHDTAFTWTLPLAHGLP